MKTGELIEQIESRIKELAARTEEAKASEEVTQYLRFLSRFHRYSLHNTMAIWIHCPNATHVAGYKHGKARKEREEGRKASHLRTLHPCVPEEMRRMTEGSQGDRLQGRLCVRRIADRREPLPKPLSRPGAKRTGLFDTESIARSHGITWVSNHGRLSPRN